MHQKSVLLLVYKVSWLGLKEGETVQSTKAFPSIEVRTHSQSELSSVKGRKTFNREKSNISQIHKTIQIRNHRKVTLYSGKMFTEFLLLSRCQTNLWC